MRKGCVSVDMQPFWWRKDRAMNLLPICLLIKRLNSTICRCHQSVTKVGLFADVSKTAESQNERSRF